MCIGGKQPEAPTNSPSYAPDDAYKHFEITSQEVGKDETKQILQTDDPQKVSTPKVKTSNDSIRM